MNSKKFWEIVEIDRQIIATWPEWMQRIVITAETASTGRFIRNTSTGSTKGEKC